MRPRRQLAARRGERYRKEKEVGLSERGNGRGVRGVECDLRARVGVTEEAWRSRDDGMCDVGWLDWMRFESVSRSGSETGQPLSLFSLPPAASPLRFLVSIAPSFAMPRFVLVLRFFSFRSSCRAFASPRQPRPFRWAFRGVLVRFSAFRRGWVLTIVLVLWRPCPGGARWRPLDPAWPAPSHPPVRSRGRRTRK